MISQAHDCGVARRHRFFALLCILAATLWVDSVAAQSGLNQRSTGDCSPNISAGGNVTVVCPPRPGQMPCDDISEGALSEWNAKVIQNNGNWNALVFIGEAKIHLLSTYCDKNSKITKSRYATTYGLLGIAYLYTGDKASGCRSLQQASKYYSDIGNEDDLVNVKGAMRKAGC